MTMRRNASQRSKCAAFAEPLQKTLQNLGTMCPEVFLCTYFNFFSIFLEFML